VTGGDPSADDLRILVFLNFDIKGKIYNHPLWDEFCFFSFELDAGICDERDDEREIIEWELKAKIAKFIFQFLSCNVKSLS